MAILIHWAYLIHNADEGAKKFKVNAKKMFKVMMGVEKANPFQALRFCNFKSVWHPIFNTTQKQKCSTMSTMLFSKQYMVIVIVVVFGHASLNVKKHITLHHILFD